MDSSSSDSEEEICWWNTKNRITKRLINHSLIHTLKRAGGSQKESKQINISLRTYVQRKLRERRQSLNNTNNQKTTSDTYTTDSESSGMDEVFMLNGKPSTSPRFRNNHRANSKSSLNKANVKSESKVKPLRKYAQAYSKKSGKIENCNPNRRANSSKVLIRSNQGTMILSHDVNNGVIDGKNNENDLSNAKEDIKDTLNSNRSNILSEQIKDPVRRLPKGPATIKKNLFNTVRDSESDVHECQEIISCDSASCVNQNKDGINTSGSLYEYTSVFNEDTGRSRNATLSSDDILMWRIDTTCESTNDSRLDSIGSNESSVQYDRSIFRTQKVIPAINKSKTEERAKNDSTVSVLESDNSTLDNNSDVNMKEINILDTSNESDDVSKVIKSLPNSESIESDSFHENVNISEESDPRIKESNRNTSDRNHTSQKLTGSVKFRAKNDESSKEELLSDVRTSARVFKNVEKNVMQEIKSPTRSLSLSRCESVSTDDSIRTRFMPKVTSTEILSTRYKIVKLQMEREDTFVHPLITSSPNAKSLYYKSNAVNEISDETRKNLEDSQCTVKAEDNCNVPIELNESDPEETKDSYTAINIVNHTKKIHDFNQENSESSDYEEADSLTLGRTLNCEMSDESQNNSLNGKEYLTYPRTSRAKEMLHEETSCFQRKQVKIDQRNAPSSNEAIKVIDTKVTYDQENEDNSSVSSTHTFYSNGMLSSTFTDNQSSRCFMQTLNTREEMCDATIMKEYEEQLLKKRAQRSTRESNNSIRDRRPVKLQDLIAQNNFTEETSVASLTMNDISDDDEIFIFEIPKTVDVENFRDKKFRFEGDNEIVIGEKNFEVYERENQTMSIVLKKGDLVKSYGAVNLKAVRSVYVRPKILKREIKARRMEQVEEVSRATTVPFPKNLRRRHPLLGSNNIVAKNMSDSNENEMTVTSKKILKWLASQDEYDDDENSMKNEQHTMKQAKPRKQIGEKQDENVAIRVEDSDAVEASIKEPRLKSNNYKDRIKDTEMQYNPVKDIEKKRETSIASTPRKKRSIVLSDTLHETGTTNDDTLSTDSKLKKKMPKKQNQERVDKRERVNESDSKALPRKSSISCSEADSDIPKENLKSSFEYPQDIILTYDETALVKSARKMKVNCKMEISGKQAQSDAEGGVLKDENNLFRLEGSNVNDKKRMRKLSKRQSSDDFDVSTEIYEYVSSPESTNAAILLSSPSARGKEQKRSASSSEVKQSFVQDVKRKTQLERSALSESGLEKTYLVNESSRDKYQPCDTKITKNKKKKHMSLKDLLKRSYPPKVIPTLSPKKRCHSLNKFARNIESKSGIGRRKKFKFNITHTDDAENEDESMNSEKFIDPNRTSIPKKYKDRRR